MRKPLAAIVAAGISLALVACSDSQADDTTALEPAPTAANTAPPAGPSNPAPDTENVLGPLNLIYDGGVMSSEVTLRFPTWNFTASIDSLNEDAYIEWSPPFDYTFTLTRTNGGRTVPGDRTTAVLLSYYDIDSPACADDYRTIELTLEDYCVHNLMLFDRSDEPIEPGGTIHFWQSEGGWGPSSLTKEGFRPFRVPEEDGVELAAALSEPVDYLLQFNRADVTGGDCDDLTLTSVPDEHGNVTETSVVGFGPICQTA